MLKRFDQPAMGNLITFEAAARTGSFTKAALELAVGQPAVSHAIRLLEDDLGVVLFDRIYEVFPLLWDDGDAQDDGGIQVEPDWDLAAQAAL